MDTKLNDLNDGGSNRETIEELMNQKDRDLELAAKIGQSLLEQNRELQTKNEFLEESVSKNLETIIQLKHELNQRIELLRVYSHLDDDGVPRSPSDESLRERLHSTKHENDRLRKECESLRKEAQAMNSERSRRLKLEMQLDDANDKIINLQRLIDNKSEEIANQSEKCAKLVQELANKEKKERMLESEKDEMSEVLIEMIQRHDVVNAELKEMQEQYAELMATFAETESELVRIRNMPANQRSVSYDSLYDSLASEMENSESGIRDAPPHSYERISKVLPTEIQNEIKTPTAPTKTMITTGIQCDPEPSTLSSIDELRPAEPCTSSTPIRSAPNSPTCRALYTKLHRLHFQSHPRSSTPKLEPRAQIADYDGPKLGQPGIPGTRDLDVSLKMIKAREEVEKEFAAFCQRRGVTETEFFSGNEANAKKQQSSQSWIDYSMSYGARLLQNLRPNIDDTLPFLNSRQGVLTRAELHAPGQSPVNRPSNLSIGLSPLNNSFGLSHSVSGVLQRR